MHNADFGLRTQAKNPASKVDVRLTFLARAAARFELVEAGSMGVREAIAGLMPAMAALVAASTQEAA